MKSFDRYIYCADMHGSNLFESFIDNFNDGKTKFYILGDIFDRGSANYEIIEKIMKLYSSGYLEMVLGNHDLFFIIGVGLHDISNSKIKELSNKLQGKEENIKEFFETFYGQLCGNGGRETLMNLKKGYGADYKEKLDKIINFLWNNFSLYHIDELGNILVHGGIPILDDGSIVGEEIDGIYYSGIDYIIKLDEKLKKFDIPTLEKLSSIHYEYGNKIYEDMHNQGTIINEKISGYQKSYHGTYFTPTWFANSGYELKSGILMNSLKAELERKNLKRLIVGHWFSSEKDFSELEGEYAKKYYNTLIRLDRCSIHLGHKLDEEFGINVPIYGNFGYCIINNQNEILEIGDAKDIA